jgi:HK97 family phage portal protein
LKNKQSWSTRVLDWAAKQAGYSIVPPRRLSGIEPYFKFFGNAVVYGNWNQGKYIDEGYTKNATLYSIVNRITSVSAQAAETFRVYKIRNEAKAKRYKAWTGQRATKESILSGIRLKQEAYEIDDSHPFNAILERPNQWQGANEFAQTSIGFKLITGNRFLFLMGPQAGANSGQPIAIYNLPPQHMNIIGGNDLWDVAGYELQLDKVTPIPKELVLHSRYWNPVYDANGSHLWGMSPVSAGARRLDIAEMAERRSGAMMANAGAAGVLFNKQEGAQLVGDVSKMKQILNEEILGLTNAEKIHLANGDLGYINFGMKAADLEIIEQERYTDEKLCNIYAVPPGLFMASANATDNNIAAWNRQLIQQAVIPALADIRDDFNKILGLYGTGYYVDYDIKIFPEMQEDLEKLSRTLDKMYYLKPNEKRILTGNDEDLDEPMMSKYLVPSGLVEISSLNPDNMDPELDAVDDMMIQQTVEEDAEQ